MFLTGNECFIGTSFFIGLVYALLQSASSFQTSRIGNTHCAKFDRAIEYVTNQAVLPRVLTADSELRR
jgi:hypothetical protein